MSPTNVCSSISLNSHDMTCLKSFTGSVQQSIPQEKKQHPQPHTHPSKAKPNKIKHVPSHRLKEDI